MNVKLALVAASLALFGSASTLAQESRAVQVDILGRGPAVDARAFSLVRSSIARSVVDNEVSRFDVAGFGVEGGFSACVELRTADQARELLTRLQRIQPDRTTTSYNVQLVASCPCK